MHPAAPRWPAVTLAVLTGLNLCNYLDRYVLPAMLTPIKRDLGLTDTRFATIVTAFMLGYFLTAPIFGYLGDRWSRKALVVAGVVAWCIGSVLSGRAHGFASLLCFRVVVGLGEASYGTISPGWIADLYAPARRNTMLSIFFVAIPLGSALGFILGGSLAAAYSWRIAFLVAAIPGLVLAAVLLLLPEPVRGRFDPAAAAAEPARGGFATYVRLFKIPAYRLVVAGYVAQTFALGGFANWAAEFLERTHHMGMVAADHFFGIALAATGLTATMVGGAWATAWNRRNPAGYAWVLALSAAAAVPVAFAAFLVPDLLWAKLALVAAMFLLFLSTGPVNTIILETVPVTMRASAMAASILAIHACGDLWSPQMVARLSDRWGDLRLAVLATLPEAILVCAGFWIWLAVQQGRAARRA